MARKKMQAGMQKNKKNRRFRGSVRKTLGALFMATAILVAAVPVENIGAAPSGQKVTVDVNNCRIPLVGNNETIYTTGDGSFQFAYVSANDISSSNKVAVILGYDGGYLEGGSLTIPDTVDAYLKYSDNLGTSYGYCAVSKNGKFLYYEEKTPQKDASGQYVYRNTGEPQKDTNGNVMTDENGNTLYVMEQVFDIEYRPCYYSDRAKWQDLEVDEFFYNTSGSNFAQTKSSDYQPIKDAKVKYIGNQYLKAGTGADAGTWSIGGVVENKDQGVFRGEKAGNIVSLKVGEELSGVGNYAFYGCSNLQSISLGNGLDTIGNYAFANCINMSTVNVDINAMVTTIGDHAFYNCDGLQSFTMPISVISVGDSAFEDCYSLKNVELCGNGKNVALATLGYDVFKNCASLESVELPQNYTENNLKISMWEGCNSLKCIKVNNGKVNFLEENGFTFQDFKNTVPREFYFEGMKGTDLYQTASDNYIAFKYYGEDIYEILVDDGAGHKALYQVNSGNQLEKCEIPEGMETVQIPETVGPYRIQTIWGTSFRNNCYLKEVVIPSSVLEIEGGAFKGCHNLETVFFSEPVNLTSIVDEAFQTQDIADTEHKQNCPNKTLAQKPSLYFVGPLDSECAPFKYAMKEVNKLNVLGQERAYITYCSGWPTNLLVQYDPDTGKNTLISYPTFKEISNYSLGTYPYLEQENITAASQAVSKYIGGQTMTDGEKEIINAALNLELPYGVEAIKEGLFRQSEAAENYDVNKTLTAYGLKTIDDETFKDCRNFTGIHIKDTTDTIGDGAFENCTNLTDVTISNTVTKLGSLPFYGCTKLNYVNFMNSPYYTCPSSAEAMIYELDDSGNPYKVVEMLQGRSNRRIDASELEGVSELAEGAFKGTNVGNVDLRGSSITVIPKEAFAETDNLDTIYFPRNWNRVDQDAFRNSAVEYLEIYGEYGNIDNNAFSGTTNDSGLMTFYCEEGSAAENYAKQNHIRTVNIPAERYYTVTFYDYDMKVLGAPQSVQAGADAVPPATPSREGYVFTGWSFDYHNITKDMEIKAEYQKDTEYNTVLVTFYDYDGKQIGDAVRIASGSDVTNPPVPSREGYIFVGWSEDLKNVTKDINPHALYEYNTGTYTVTFLDTDEKTVLYKISVKPGEDCILPVAPTKSGKNFVKWTPSPVKVTADMSVVAVYEDATNSNSGGNNNNNNNNNNGNGNSNSNTQLYTLTVKNGLGTGSFVAGAPVVIKAQEAGTNQEFVNWTVDPSDVTITDKNVSAAIITMPAKNVTVTANFKAKSGSGSGSGSTTPTPAKSSGTTVVIDKNGLSNTGVVSAAVNGSSDNFTIKVREDANASELALRALKAEFGDDLSNVKYFPMDISLYDSTGKNMVTDTTGLSINITLPLPDSMVQYAGNNKVASVSGGKLEKLNAKFTTISGVSCISFKAEHFSPYVIYVNTQKLASGGNKNATGSAGTSGGIRDVTPKTGDGIHPKWFLSIGLACVSVFLFLKKDRKLRKVPVRASNAGGRRK